MAFDQDKRSENENKKFVEDASGDTAVRIKIVDGIQLGSGEEFIIKDFRGFTIFKVTEDGDIWHKGSIFKF